jgi:hypothetical protein
MNIPRLFRRDQDPPICGEVDGYVLILDRAEPEDLPCREPLRTVPAHCNRCGHITAAPSCPTHPAPLRCPTCTLAGEPSHVEPVETAAVS